MGPVGPLTEILRPFDEVFDLFRMTALLNRALQTREPGTPYSCWCADTACPCVDSVMSLELRY
jgi:hypothetical protein